MRVLPFRSSALPARCVTRIAILALCGAFHTTISLADEQVTAVQEALKEQQFFFGEVNGERDEETRAAVRRFQIHSGLQVTGEIDAATIAAIEQKGTAEPAEPAAEPAGERSVRGRMRTLVRSDEEFLEDVEATPARPARSVIPGLETRPPADRAVAPITAPTEPEPSRPPEPERRANTELERPREPEREPARSAERTRPPEARGMSEAQAQEFIRDYLDAAEGPTPEREVAFYDNRVDYFDSGRVNRQFIEKDQKNYYRRWPNRDFALVEAPELVRSSEDSATIRFRTRYNLSGKSDRASGKIENVVRVTRDDSGNWKIASIRERKVSE